MNVLTIANSEWTQSVALTSNSSVSSFFSARGLPPMRPSPDENMFESGCRALHHKVNRSRQEKAAILPPRAIRWVRRSRSGGRYG